MNLRLVAPVETTTGVTPVVTVRQGRLRGALAGGVHVFRGIPYAAPPFGVRHLLPPQPPYPWTGIRSAFDWGPEPSQPRPDAEIQRLVPDPAFAGEDCLNLNVWTPTCEPAGLPVMVWIPGGMFEAGTGASYDGSRFARDGVVCVTINYRVGAEGFLCLGDGVANAGLLDQVAALEWVRDNIAAFGGDPRNVTVFGESAGAMSIGVLLAMPRGARLFRRAILQSGAAHHVMTPKAARHVGTRLAGILGVPATREAIAAVEPERIVAAQLELKGELLAHPDPALWGFAVVATTLPFHPVVDGDVVPAPPIERIAAGVADEVGLLIGTNTEDWRLFLALGDVIDEVADADLRGPVAVHGCRSLAAYRLEVHEALAAYRAAYPGATPGDLLAAVQTDWWCRVPALRLADAHARASVGTWMYELAWKTPALGGRLGACHALEIPFVFDTLDTGEDQVAGPMLGPVPPQALADAMHGAWVSFAVTGDPGWPRYDLERRATMRFDTVSRVVDDPHPWERALWEGVR